MKILTAFTAALVMCALALPAFAQVAVRGYTRKDGTYVQPHMRSNPDGIRSNNYSAEGNSNPYTGSIGGGRGNSGYSNQFQSPTLNNDRAPSGALYQPSWNDR